MADTAAIDALAKEIHRCQRCGLANGRTRSVPGEGNPHAEIMFIGEAPGFTEDQTGKPFCGAAGNFLTQLITSIGLKREEVYITNIVKSRPPGNRDPLPEEILACKPWLDQQLEIIKPKVIVTLGRYSMARFFPGATISRIHGQSETCGPYTCFAPRPANFPTGSRTRRRSATCGFRFSTVISSPPLFSTASRREIVTGSPKTS